MSRDDLIRDTFAHFGLAFYQAQVLEHGIVNAMVVAKMPDRERLTRRDIDSFMDQQFENTLGQLIRAVKKHVAVPGELEDQLTEALSKRNWLAHEYFRARAVDFMTDAGCHRMIEELELVQRLFEDTE